MSEQARQEITSKMYYTTDWIFTGDEEE